MMPPTGLRLPEGSPGWPYAPGCNAGVNDSVLLILISLSFQIPFQMKQCECERTEFLFRKYFFNH